MAKMGQTLMAKLGWDSKVESSSNKTTFIAKLGQTFMAKSGRDSKTKAETTKQHEDPNEHEQSTYIFLEAMSRRACSNAPQYRAWNTRKKKMVAMREEVNRKWLSRTTKAEIETLETLGPHPCILRCEGGVVTKEGRLFVAMEYVSSDLETLRKENRKPYSLIEIKHIIKNILNGVAFLHENDVVHGDLNPANILINVDVWEIKICGLARRHPCAGLLWYRAPELLLGPGASTCTWAVDVWSVGCIMAEILVDHVFFMGFSDAEQLDCIRRAVRPPCELLRRKIAAEKYSEAAAELTPAGFDLLERLLTYKANKRITAREALHHPWFCEITSIF